MVIITRMTEVITINDILKDALLSKIDERHKALNNIDNEGMIN